MTKREKIAEIHNLPIEQICCKYCDRKEQRHNVPYCTWYQIKCKDEEEDYCKFWINTRLYE